MDIMIIDIDSKQPNLALKKIEKYHLDRGDSVVWNMPLMRNVVDKTYVSCIFDWNKPLLDEWLNDETVDIGGSGYSLTKTLPPEIENIKPHLNFGFTSRGCIRKCPFCIVPDKEGYVHAVGDLLDLWDGKAKDVTIMDNNILALPEHFKLICEQAIKHKIRVDHNQGLDHRLLNDENCELLKRTPHKKYHFAFDHPSYLQSVEKAIDLLNRHEIKWSTWYVLVGFNTLFEEDLFRLNFLKEHNLNAYVMRYSSVKSKKKYIELARWANQHHIFHGYTWEKYIDKRLSM